jgi:hypothetical protein
MDMFQIENGLEQDKGGATTPFKASFTLRPDSMDLLVAKFQIMIIQSTERESG